MSECEKEKTLLLLEHEGHVKDCLSWLAEAEGSKEVVALSPFAMHELDKNGIPYRIIDEFYAPRDLYEIGIANFRRVEELCDVIDAHVTKCNPELSEAGIRLAWFSYCYVKYMYDTVMQHLFQLRSLLEAEKPCVVTAYETKTYAFGASEAAPYLLFDNRESVYAHLLALPGWPATVKMLSQVCHPASEDFERLNHGDFLSKARLATRRRVMAHPTLCDMALNLKKRDWCQAVKRMKELASRRTCWPLLLFGEGYNWDECRAEMAQEGLGPIYRVEDDLHWLRRSPLAWEGGVPSPWSELREHDAFREFFIWGGIDFFPVVETRLRFLVEQLPSVCLVAYKQTRETIARRGIKGVIASTFSTCVGHSVAHAAHKLGVPVVTWQHGNYGTTKYPLADYNDVMSSDFHLVFGEGVAEQYQDAARRFDTRLIAVGSAAIERIARSSLSPRCTVEGPSQRGRKKVVYVTTNYWASNSYITYFPPPSDNKHWLAQKAIIDVLGKHAEHPVIVKLHPNLLYREPPLRSYVKERGFRNIEFVRREYSFPALLASADVIVGDFASTTMLQALATSKPIFVYLGIHHLDEQPMELLRRRAVCEADLEAFTGKLDQYLSCEKSVGIELTNRDFAERYGNMSGEGSAGERAAKALRQILEASEVSSCADRIDPRSTNGADIERRGVETP